MEIQIDKLHKQAVDAALASEWKKAVEVNETILELDEDYVDAYLGLGFAHLQLGDLKKAKRYYNKALKYDPANIIARNNVEKITILSKKGDLPDKINKRDVSLDPNTFMHSKGKTQVVTLINTGQADVLAKLKIGEKVFLKLKKRRVEVRTKKDEYIGALPDDISKRIAFFIDAKSKYTVFVKASTKNSVDIFIREDKKGAKVKNFVSFPDNIQDDLKIIIGKSNENEANALAGNNADGEHDDEDDDEEAVDDPEELAQKAAEQKEKEEFLGINTDNDDDYDE